MWLGAPLLAAAIGLGLSYLTCHLPHRGAVVRIGKLPIEWAIIQGGDGENEYYLNRSEGVSHPAIFDIVFDALVRLRSC